MAKTLDKNIDILKFGYLFLFVLVNLSLLVSKIRLFFSNQSLFYFNSRNYARLFLHFIVFRRFDFRFDFLFQTTGAALCHFILIRLSQLVYLSFDFGSNRDDPNREKKWREVELNGGRIR